MALRFWVNGGVNTNWSTTGNWSLTSGGAGGQAVPSAVDDVTFDAASTIDCVLDTAVAKLAKSLTCTAYTHTLTFNVTLSVSGNITLGTGVTLAGTQALIILAASTLTTNTKVINIPFTINFNGTVTLADVCNVSGLLTLGIGNVAITLTSFSINASGSVAISSTNNVGGTCVLNVTGTGTFTHGATGGINLTVNFNTAGTITITGNIGLNTGTLNYVAGTVNATAATLSLTGPATVNVAALTWSAINAIQSATVTLNGNLTCTGLLTLGATGANTTLNGNTIFVGNGLAFPANGRVVNGTTNLVLTGTGNINMLFPASGTVLRNNITLSGGTITFTSDFAYGTGIFTVTGAVVVFTGLLTILTSCSLDMAGSTIGSLLCNLASVVITLRSTLNLVTALTLIGGVATPILLNSNTGGTQRKLTCASGINLDILYCNPTDIDSSSGVPVFYAKGTVTNTSNWVSLAPFQSKTSQVVVGGVTYSLGSGGGAGSSVFIGG